MITLQAFKDTALVGHPGWLAAVVYHETRHRRDFTTLGADTHEQGEIRALTQHVKAATVFELDKRVVKGVKVPDTTAVAELASLRDRYIKDVRDHVQSSVFALPEQEGGLREGWLKQPDFRKDFDALARAVEKRRQTMREEHLRSLRKIAADMCKNVVIDQQTFDRIGYVDDRTFYSKTHSNFWRDLKRVPDCVDETYGTLLSQLSHHGRLHTWMFPRFERVPDVEPPTAPRVPDPPKDIFAPKPRVPVGGEEDLRDLVIRACKDPATLKDPPLPDLSWFPAPGYRFPIGFSDGMDSCQTQLWHYLLDRNEKGQSLDLDDVTQRAWGYQYRPQPSASPCTPRGIWSKECYQN